MIITDERWNDIIKATEANIAELNARAAEQKRLSRFSVTVRDSGPYSVLLTGHNGDHHVVVREVATGEMRSANVVKKRRKGVGKVITGFSVRTPDPKAWKSLANKSAEDVVRQLKLTKFFIALGATAEKWSTTIGGQRIEEHTEGPSDDRD
jgi:hypothetical protein